MAAKTKKGFPPKKGEKVDPKTGKPVFPPKKKKK